jgi:pimeloyl-ACP methyl ester carboxylesterase
MCSLRLATVAALPALLALAGVARANGHLKSHEHTTERAGLNISIYEKWLPGEEQKWRQNGKVVLLVHGATWSSHCTFDPVENYSLMDTLAEQGWDVWAVDLHGYGKSGKTERDWTESPSASEDIDAAVDYISALRWVQQVHVLGYQWGAQPAGIFAMKKPKKIGKLILFGMRYNSTEPHKDPTEQYRSNSGKEMLRPDDGDLDPEFVHRRGPMCIKSDPKSPNGALRDLARQSFVDPAQVKAPTLMIQGQKDGDDALLQDRIDFFKQLASHTKAFSILGGLGKYANFEKKRSRFEAAVLNFLEQP